MILRVLFAVCIAVFAIGGFGCSGGAGNTAEDAANTTKESQFAYITDPKVALAEGNRLFDENQTELAIEAYIQAVTLDPDLAEAYFKMGIAYALIESEIAQSGVPVPQTNDENSNSSERKKPNSERAFEKAITAYKKWLKDNPDDDVAHFNLGRSYAKLNKDESAEDQLREAVRLKPEDTEYQTELGAILVRLAKYHEAIGPLKKAIELDPENLRAENLLEDAEAGRKRVDYVPPSNSDAKGNSNSDANSNTSSNGNTVRPTANTNTRPGANQANPKTPVPPSNKPKPN